jgi:hypothetical protein
MTRSPFKALLFAAIFLAGNLVLPEADILLGHGRNQANETRVHLEQLGGCRNHTEHCVLSRLLSDLSGQAPSSSLAFHAAFSASAVLLSAGDSPATRYFLSYNHSRAPPAPQASAASLNII